MSKTCMNGHDKSHSYISFSERQTTITQALGNKFNYKELMEY